MLRQFRFNKMDSTILSSQEGNHDDNDSKIYIYIPGTQMTSIFEGQPLKTRPFRTKRKVIWVPGIYRSKIQDHYQRCKLVCWFRKINRTLPFFGIKTCMECHLNNKKSLLSKFQERKQQNPRLLQGDFWIFCVMTFTWPPSQMRSLVILGWTYP